MRPEPSSREQKKLIRCQDRRVDSPSMPNQAIGQTRRTLWFVGRLIIGASLCASLVATGCKKPRVGQSPAPDLRGPVNDLTAVRAGENLALSWTMPKKRSAKLVVNGRISVKVCRRENPTSPCIAVGEPSLLAPGVTGSFSEQLPPALTTGSPWLLYYFVELLDAGGHSTGLSNSVATLAGAPLPAVQNLTTTSTKNGVLLHWTQASSREDPPETIIRLHCVRIIQQTPHTDDATSNLDPEEHDLWVKGDTGEVLDKDARSGSSYEYTAQRVVRIAAGNQQLELPGQLSAPANVDTGIGSRP